MRLVESARDLLQIEHHLVWRQCLLFANKRSELLTSEQVHHQERRPRGLVNPGIGDADEVIALDVTRDLSFEFETAPQIRMLD
ncbi:hypothetical protein BE15_43535 [Sorangium cellulosum]|uniref:Uncharacterized protein n=1 Tax=Sorangium cellulosum TaxID=56 RepID=A0A150PYX1_SORCE|nr:hypothetical protein BE15_43535 [Sorangium cellulosum]